jgi:lysophospholipase L1-like esterase
LKRLFWPVLVVALAARCGDSPTGPSGPGPSISCPPPVRIESLDGRPVTATYTTPQATGGQQPVTVTCAPASGTAFPVGSTTVTCEAVDRANRQTSCSFFVSVTRPRLVATRFLAFGDSLTLGVIRDTPTLLLADRPDSYPFELQRLLTARYQTQTPEVLNDGVGGETAARTPASQSVGRLRLPGSLDANRPDVLLLMEGTNDLLSGESGATNALVALEEMVIIGRARGARVLLATIPPQRAGGIRQRDRVAAMIPGFNDSIRQIAARQGVPLVDVYRALENRLDLIGVDDLHPTPQGYDLIAATSFDVIRARLEENQPSAIH